MFTSAVIPMLLGGWWAFASGPSVLAVVGAIASAWYGTGALLAWRMEWPISWRFPFAVLARNVIVQGRWSAAWFSSEVVWRGNAMSIGTNGATSLEPASAD